MGTHCAIGVELEHGTVAACYCHYDGYIAYAGTILYNRYRRADVFKLVKFGEISDLPSFPPVAPPVSNKELVFLDKEQYFKEFDQGVEFLYLLDKKNEWYVYIIGQGGVVRLEDFVKPSMR